MNIEQRVEEVKRLLGEQAKDTVLTKLSPDIHQLQLGERQLRFNPDNLPDFCRENFSGYITYTDTNWNVHCYGAFPPSSTQSQQAADYLLNPQTPPPAIQQDVDEIVNGLIAKGVSKEEISVNWSRRPDMPVISRGQYRVEFGLYSPGTMNVFHNIANKDNKFGCGLVGTTLAIEYLNNFKK